MDEESGTSQSVPMEFLLSQVSDSCSQEETDEPVIVIVSDSESEEEQEDETDEEEQVTLGFKTKVLLVMRCSLCLLNGCF